MSKTRFDPQHATRLVTVRSGLTRPGWTKQQKVQIALLARDASSSMAGEKARDAEAASSGLVAALAAPENRDAFSVGVIDFASDVRIAAPITKARDLVNAMPALGASGHTNITGALVEAKRLLGANAAMAGGGLPSVRPVVLLFSDGQHNVGDTPHAAAAALKAEADVVTVAFGSDADETLLIAIATSPNHFYRCRDGKELRKFFAAVGGTLSRSLANGVNAGAALATIRP